MLNGKWGSLKLDDLDFMVCMIDWLLKFVLSKVKKIILNMYEIALIEEIVKLTKMC